MGVLVYSKKKMQRDYGIFKKRYSRKKSGNGYDPNDRSYDRKFEAKLKRMKAEDIQDLIDGVHYNGKIPPIPPIEKIAEDLYDKQLSFVDKEIVKVIYNKDKTKRFILLKSSNGFYKYTYEEICVVDEDEWSVCYDVPDAYPAYWLPKDKTFAYSFFGTENEAVVSMKQEAEYLQYFE